MINYKTKAGKLISEFLEERFNMVIKGQIDPNNIRDIIDQRDVFYTCQKEYKNLYPKEETFDLSHTSQLTLQQATDKVIKQYCKRKLIYFWEHPNEFPDNIDKDVLGYWGIFRRKALAIQAKERATAYGYSGSFPVIEKDSSGERLREKLRDEAFIMIICEKLTVGMKVLNELKDKGYEVNLIISGGFNVCEIIETILEIKEEDDNFYIFILHDMEPPGYSIFHDAYQYLPNRVFSIGLNPEMARQVSLDLEISKEPYKPPQNIVKHIETIPILKQWYDDNIIDHTKERIQLISNLVNYVVEYVEYIVKIHCKKWNLNRVDKPYVTHPDKLREFKEQVNLWAKIEERSIGKYFVWTKPSYECKDEFLRQNKKYRKDITKYKDEIILESQVLQKIVNTHPRTKRNIRFLEYKIQNLNKFLDIYYWEKVEFVEYMLYIFFKIFWFCF